MKQLRNKLVYILLAFTLMVQAIGFTVPTKAVSDELGINAKAAILIDAATGKILYQKNAETPLPIASMTKMMSEYLVLGAVKEGKISWDQTVRVSDYVHKVSQNTALSNVPLEKDGQYKVKELYEAMAIYSANGATIALAELVGGSETNFIKLMNNKAKELGMKNYKFVNSSGLNNRDLYNMYPQGTGAEDENVLSAHDTGLLAYHMLKEYPELLQTSSIPKKVFQEGGKYPINMENWNWMLPSLVYGYEGVDGIKTGSTDAAGYCFTGTAKRGENRVISVVMDTNSYKARFDETKKLFDYGFNNFSKHQVLAAGSEVKDKKNINVTKGKKDKVGIKTTTAVDTVVRNGDTTKYKQTVVLDKKKLTKDGELTAPVKKGEKVGKLILTPTNESDYGYITGEKTLEVDVVTTASVEKANVFVLFFRGIGDFFSNIFSSASNWITSKF